MSNLHLSGVQSSPILAELAQNELHKRLRLYQVFSKLYEHHGALLNQILQLENVTNSSLTKTKQNYVQAVVNEKEPYIITNLKEGKSQCLRQAQQIWTIGRNESSGICIYDRHVSRRHAAIQYCQEKGFRLVDFNSTNGSYINGERVYQPRELRDGDCIRLGIITFSFFINSSTQVLPTVAAELLMQLVPKKNQLTTRRSKNISSETKPFPSNSNFSPDSSEEKLQKPNVSDRHFVGISILERYLAEHQNSEIINSFLSKTKNY